MRYNKFILPSFSYSRSAKPFCDGVKIKYWKKRINSMVFVNKTHREEKCNLFSIEGPDGVGKSTVISQAHALSAKAFLRFKTPPEQIAGVRSLYDSRFVNINTRFSYYFGSNLLLSDIVRPLLADNLVGVDRMILSTIAYHNVLSGKKDAFTWFLRQYFDLGGIFPDITIVLTAEKEARLKRLNFRPQNQNTEHDLDLDLSSRVQDEYLRLVVSKCYSSQFFVIDTTNMSLDSVARFILQTIGVTAERNLKEVC